MRVVVRVARRRGAPGRLAREVHRATSEVERLDDGLVHELGRTPRDEGDREQAGVVGAEVGHGAVVRTRAAEDELHVVAEVLRRRERREDELGVEAEPVEHLGPLGADRRRRRRASPCGRAARRRRSVSPGRARGAARRRRPRRRRAHPRRRGRAAGCGCGSRDRRRPRAIRGAPSGDCRRRGTGVRSRTSSGCPLVRRCGRPQGIARRSTSVSGRTSGAAGPVPR